MTATASRVNKPAWVDLSSTDAAASRDFYTKLLGWNIEVDEDPQYGGYGIARVDGEDVAGIGPQMTPGMPSVWSLYIGAADSGTTAQAVEAAGGTVVMQPFDVDGQGRMAVFQDPSGAFISAWQPSGMGSFRTGGAGTFAWAELNARGLDKAVPFYGSVFGWTTKVSPMGEGLGDYTEFQADGVSILGAMEMNPGVPAEVPSYWMVYFGVEDVDGAFSRAIDLGATEMVAPSDFPGGRFAIVSDPQGAMFGLLKTE